MSFLKNLFGGSSAKPTRNEYIFSVKCRRCGEVIEGRVDLANDLSVEYEGDDEVYYSRKTLIGTERCFQRLEAEFKFSSDRTLIEQKVTGGEFVS